MVACPPGDSPEYEYAGVLTRPTEGLFARQALWSGCPRPSLVGEQNNGSGLVETRRSLHSEYNL